MEFDYQKILDCIPPSCTDRNQWVQVGMALKQEGQPFEMFDRWSAGDSRPNQYRGSEVTRKVWDSFKNSGSGTVTGATLTLMARDLGMDPFPASDGFMDWGDEITSDGVEPVQKTIRPPRPDKSRKDVFQIIDYLEEKGIGKKSINYRLRDWLISRPAALWIKKVSGNLSAPG